MHRRHAKGVAGGEVRRGTLLPAEKTHAIKDAELLCLVAQVLMLLAIANQPDVRVGKAVDRFDERVKTFASNEASDAEDDESVRRRVDAFARDRRGGLDTSEIGNDFYAAFPTQ